MKAPLLALVVCGCAANVPESGAGWQKIPAPLAPIAIDVDPAAWRASVAASVDRWNAELVAQGCAPAFTIASVGHAVRGYTAAAWPHNTAWLGVEFEGDESIDLVADYAGAQNTLLHELGHALGLVHVTDRPSLMNPRSGELTPDDVADACALR